MLSLPLLVADRQIEMQQKKYILIFLASTARQRHVRIPILIYVGIKVLRMSGCPPGK